MLYFAGNIYNIAIWYLYQGSISKITLSNDNLNIKLMDRVGVVEAGMCSRGRRVELYLVQTLSSLAHSTDCHAFNTNRYKWVNIYLCLLLFNYVNKVRKVMTEITIIPDSYVNIGQPEIGWTRITEYLEQSEYYRLYKQLWMFNILKLNKL